MVPDNPIVRHWQVELKNFSTNLSLLQQQISTDPVHDLRVAVKRLRSYFKLYTAICGMEYHKKTFSQTTELFSVLGKHRNIEMSRDLLLSMVQKNREMLTPLLRYLELTLDEAAEYCRRSIQEYAMQELPTLTTTVEEGLKDVSAEDLLRMTGDLVASSLERTTHHMAHFEEKSHLVRKALKDIFYWVKIFDEDELLKKAEVKTIDDILNRLGLIQDHEVMITIAKSFRHTLLARGTGEYEFIKKIESRAKRKKKALLEEAKDMTDELIYAS